MQFFLLCVVEYNEMRKGETFFHFKNKKIKNNLCKTYFNFVVDYFCDITSS